MDNVQAQGKLDREIEKRELHYVDLIGNEIMVKRW